MEALIEHYTGLAVTPPLILLNANASDLIPLRRWSIDRYIALARRLLAHYPEIFIAFTGATEEAPKVETLSSASGLRAVSHSPGRPRSASLWFSTDWPMS